MPDISLEIHHLDVRGGDATAIIVKEHDDDGEREIYRALIDAGAEGRGSSALKFYLETYLPGPFDLVVATHYHQDHIQGFAQANIRFEQFIDIGPYKLADGKEAKPLYGIGKGARTSVFYSYVAHTQTAMVLDPVNRPSVETKPTRIPIDFIEKKKLKPGEKRTQPKSVEIELGDGTGIKLICCCASGILADGKDVIADQKVKDVSPNDLSIALLLEWGDFRYLTAGDLSGADPAEGKYYDIETPLVNYLTSPKGPLNGKNITVLKASHHGSEHSTQEHLLRKLQPETIVVCCNIQKQVPSPAFLDRLTRHFTQRGHGLVVFTNTLKVFKNDDRYAQLENIKPFTLLPNLDVGENPEQHFASNLRVKCAVIRRRMRNKKVIEQPPPPRSLIRHEFPAGHDIVLLERDAADATQVSAAIRPRVYKWHWTWLSFNCSEADIFRRFGQQARAMHQWLSLDEEKKRQHKESEDLGRLYMSDNYPALLQVADQHTENEREHELVEEMKRLFTTGFKLIEGRYQTAEVILSSDKQKTLYLLLRDNLHQLELNLALRNSTFDPRTDAWNAPGGDDKEPYLSDRDDYLEEWESYWRVRKEALLLTERKSDREPDSRPAKKTKL